MKNSREKIAQAENPKRQAEIQKAEANLDVDVWPPMTDDTDSYSQSQIGNTEGSTSLEQTDK